MNGSSFEEVQNDYIGLFGVLIGIGYSASFSTAET
jgi:hypothetical protein